MNYNTCLYENHTSSTCMQMTYLSNNSGIIHKHKQYSYDITEKDPQVDNYADEDVSQNLTGQARIPTLATQNSFHDQFSDPDYLHDDEGRKLLII